MLPEADLVIAAYSYGEFGGSVARLLAAARVGALVLIEPGTPKGFARVLGARRELLERGAHMIAPCPAHDGVPAGGTGLVPLRRAGRAIFTASRRLKGGTLNYEDEKFSYVAVSRTAVEMAAARILRRPQHQAGLITLTVCTPVGVETRRVTKRDRQAFREARHAVWGGAIRGR